MSTTVVEIFIARPPQEVFAFISNFENNPVWQHGMKVCKFTSEGEYGVGTTYDQEAAFIGRPILTSFKVIEYEPDRLVKATSTKSTFPITFTRMVEPVDGGSQVKAIIEGEPDGVFKVFGRLLDRMVQRSIEKDYARLKLILEGN